MASSSMVQKIAGESFLPKRIADIVQCIREHGEEAARLFYDYSDDELHCSGYHEMNGGLHISYGMVLPSSDGYVEFPRGFPSHVFNVQAMVVSDDVQPAPVVRFVTTTGFSVEQHCKTSLIQYIAIGS